VIAENITARADEGKPMRGRTQPVSAQLPARSNGYCYEPYSESTQIYDMRKHGNRNNIIPTPLTPSGRCAGSASRQRSSSRRVNSINGGATVGWSLRRAGAAAPCLRRAGAVANAVSRHAVPCRVLSYGGRRSSCHGHLKDDGESPTRPHSQTGITICRPLMLMLRRTMTRSARRATPPAR